MTEPKNRHQSKKDSQMEQNNNNNFSDNDKCYPVASEDMENREPLSKSVHIPIFHPDLNNMGVDELMAKSFFDILQLKVDSGEWGAAVKRDRQDFVQLQSVLRPAYVWGTATAVTQFCLLRWGGARYIKRSIEKGFIWPWRLLLPKSGMLQDARRQQSMWQQRIVTRPDGSTKFKEGWVTKPFTLALDATVSLFSGIVVAAVKADKMEMYKAVEEIPLKEGRSPVSDVLCRDFLMQDAKIPSELWEEHTDDAMRTLRMFLDNCQKRTQYEKQLRRESLLGPRDPVSIPPPGVPRDFEIPVVAQHDEEKQVTPEIGASIVVPKAWSPEDYNLWDDDSEDDWEVNDDD